MKFLAILGTVSAVKISGDGDGWRFRPQFGGADDNAAGGPNSTNLMV